MGRGCNLLIQEGAKLVISAEDILSELNISYSHIHTKTQTEQIQPANQKESLVISYLSSDPIHIDEIAQPVEGYLHSKYLSLQKYSILRPNEELCIFFHQPQS